MIPTPEAKKKKLRERANRIERDVIDSICELQVLLEEDTLDYRKIRSQAWHIISLCGQAQAKVTSPRRRAR